MTTQRFSTQQIFVTLLFTCVAIMTSVFVYYSTHKAIEKNLQSENAYIFAAPRDIKPFELTSTNDEKISPKFFFNNWTLLFFGFTHCENICPTSLNLLNRVYTQMHPNFPNLQVLFVSLDPVRDNKKTLASYTQSFNENFVAASGKIEDLRKLQSQLGIFSSTADTTATNFQIQHSASIILVDPKGQWRGIFKTEIKPDEMQKILKDVMSS